MGHLSSEAAAKFLNISISQLNLLEKQGTLRAIKEKGEKSFLEEEVERLKSIQPLTVSQEARQVEIQLQSEVATKVSGFRKIINSVAGILSIYALAILAVTLLFVFFPLQAAGWFGYSPAKTEKISFETGDSKNVLAAQTQVPSAKLSATQALLQPVANVSLGIVKVVAPTSYEKVAKESILNPNDILARDAAGAISPVTALKVSSSNLQIENNSLINNLNAEFIQGKKPGSSVGDIAIVEPPVSSPAETLASVTARSGTTSTPLSVATVNGLNIANNGGSTFSLAGGKTLTVNNSLTFSGTDGTTITFQGTDTYVGKTTTDTLTNKTLDAGSNTITGLTNSNLSGSGAGITDSNLATITTANKVSGSAIELSSTGGIVNNSGLSLSTGCSNGQVLAWSSTNSAWQCSSTGASGVTSLNSLTGALTTAGAGINSVGTAGSTITITGTEADTLATVTGRGATSSSLLNLSGGLTLSGGTLTLPNSSVAIAALSAGNYSAKITGGTYSINISGNAASADSATNFTGSLAGNVTGTQGATLVGKINGAVLGLTTPTSGNLLIADGSSWVTKALSGDGTITSGGVLSLKNVGTAATYGSASAVPVFSTDAQGRVSSVVNTAISGLTTANFASSNISQWTNDAGFITASGTNTLTNKTIAASANTISGLTNSNLSGSAGITNANLANSGITFAADTGSSATSLGGTRTIAGGNGLTSSDNGAGTLTLAVGSGNGINVAADSISLSLSTSGTSANTSSNSGLEVSGSGLGLLRGCSNNQMLQWNAGSSVWQCATNGTTTSLSAIAAAGVANTINNTDNAQVWNWALTGAAKTAFTFGENTAAVNGAGSQYILGVSTLASSTAAPFSVSARGNKIIDTTAAGALTFGTSGVTTNNSGALTVAETLTAANGLSLTTGALNLTGTSGAFTLSGLSSSSINLGSNNLIVTSANFNTTATGINSTGIGQTAPAAAKFTSLISTGVTDLANAGASNVTIATTGTGNVAVGNSSGTLALTSNGGLNVTTAGALTGVASLNTITTSATGLTFAGAGTISSTTTSALSLDSGTTGAVNIATSANAKIITIGNTSGATALNFDTGTGGINLGDTANSKIIDIGGNDNSGTDTVRIATNSSAADTITVGNSNSSTTLSLTGGSAWSVAATGAANFSSFSGSGLTSCITAGNHLQWNASTKRFSCSADVLGNIKTASSNAAANVTATLTSFASVTITPSSTANDIWIVANMNTLDNNIANTSVTYSIWRGDKCDSGAVQVGVNSVTNMVKNGFTSSTGAMNFIDSPASASATTYQLCAIAGTAGNYPADGRQITVSEVKIGADLAEAYPSSDTSLSPGELVAMDNLTGGVKRSGRPYQADLLGIVSTNPGIVLAGNGGGQSQVLLALSGRVPVKVNLENGAINPGDYLASSSTPGVAMKATKAGTVVGTALTGYNGQGAGEVLIFVKNTAYLGAPVNRSQLENRTNVAVLAQLVSENLPTDNNLSQIITDKILAGLEIITPKLTVKDINLAGSLSIFGPDGAENVRIDALGNASFAGTLKADQIEARQIKGISILTNSLSTLEKKVDFLATNSGEIQNEVSALDVADLINSLFRKAAEFFAKVVFHADVNFLGRPTFNSDTAGLALIKKEDNEAEVNFEREYEAAPVVTASLNLAGNMKPEEAPAYAIYGITTRGFKIKLVGVAPSDLNFSWIALSVNNGGTKSVSNLSSQITPAPQANKPVNNIDSSREIPATVEASIPQTPISGPSTESAILKASQSAILEATSSSDLNF